MSAVICSCRAGPRLFGSEAVSVQVCIRHRRRRSWGTGSNSVDAALLGSREIPVP